MDDPLIIEEQDVVVLEEALDGGLLGFEAFEEKQFNKITTNFLDSKYNPKVYIYDPNVGPQSVHNIALKCFFTVHLESGGGS